MKESRERIALVTRNDIFDKHRGSILGQLWAYILPIVPVSAFVFLRLVVRPTEDADALPIHPAVFVCIGVTLWLWMRDLIMTPISSISRHRGLLANTGFPIFGAAISGLGNILFDTLIRLAFTALIVYLLSNVSPIGAAYFAGLIVCSGLLAFSFGLLIAPICLIFEDFKLLVEIALRYLIFFSFAIFPLSMNGFGEIVYQFNPFSILIVNARILLLTGEIHDPQRLLILAGLAPVILVVGLWSFYAAEPAIREGSN